MKNSTGQVVLCNENRTVILIRPQLDTFIHRKKGKNNVRNSAVIFLIDDDDVEVYLLHSSSSINMLKSHVLIIRVVGTLYTIIYRRQLL